MSPRIACLLFASLILTACTGLPAAQAQTKPAEQDQPLKLKTELIEVRAVVTDRRGQPIIDLKQEDFEVLENGRPQEVSFFSVTRLAGKESTQPAQGKEGAIKVTPARPAEAPARTAVLFADTLHLSISSLLTMKQALRRFIDEQLTDQDLVALVTSAGTLGLAEQFTRDRRILRYAVERLSPGPAKRESLLSPYLAGMLERGDPEALAVAISVLRAEESLSGPRQMLESYTHARAREVLVEATYQRRATLLTLKAVAERLAGMPGQRLIVLFSDGFTLMDDGGHMDTGDLQSVVSRAVLSGVVIYAIDAKGLQPPSLFSAARGNIGSDPRISSYVSGSERDLEDGLNALAKDTGGEPFFNTNDLRGALQKALDNNRVYYALAYYPPAEGEAKQFRRLTVRVRNHPEYVVRAQKGYLPAELIKAKKDESALSPQGRLVQAMVAPLPVTTIGVAAAADFIENEADHTQVTLRVHIDGDKLDYREQDRHYLFGLEVVTFIYDSAGKRVDSKAETIQGNLLPERLEKVKQYGFNYIKRLALKPGLYQARVGVRELASDRLGTASAWVEVPNLSRSKLALSSLILVDPQNQGGAAPAEAKGEESSKVLYGVRFFKRSNSLVYYLRVYRAANKSPDESELVMQSEFLQGDKPIAQSPWQPVSERQVGKDDRGIDVGGEIKLGNLPPGIYDLRLTIKDSKSKRTVQRTTAFGVEP